MPITLSSRAASAAHPSSVVGCCCPLPPLASPSSRQARMPLQGSPVKAQVSGPCCMRVIQGGGGTWAAVRPPERAKVPHLGPHHLGGGQGRLDLRKTGSGWQLRA